jgi:sortase A
MVTLEAPSPTTSPEPALPTPGSVTRPAADSPPTRLVIPKISVDIPVLPVGVKTIRERSGSRVIWGDVPNAGGFHQTSAYPGNPGNTVINGHRDIQGSVFRHLDKVEVGDEILLYVGEKAYPYQVSETLVVPETFASAEQRADNLKLIGNMPEERLTLVTCTPVSLATHRLLIIARPPGQIAPQMPEAGQSTQP